MLLPFSRLPLPVFCFITVLLVYVLYCLLLQGPEGGGAFGSPAPSRLSSSSSFQSNFGSNGGGSPSITSDDRNVRMLLRRDSNQRGGGPPALGSVASGPFIFGGPAGGAGVVSAAKEGKHPLPRASSGSSMRNNTKNGFRGDGEEEDFQGAERDAEQGTGDSTRRRHSRGSSTVQVGSVPVAGGGGGIVGHGGDSKSGEFNARGGVLGRGRGSPPPAAVRGERGCPSGEGSGVGGGASQSAGAGYPKAGAAKTKDGVGSEVRERWIYGGGWGGGGGRGVRVWR